MAKSARHTVFEGFELLPDALIPFVEKRMETSLKGHWQATLSERVNGISADHRGQVKWDQQNLLKTIMFCWKEAFSSVLGNSERSYVSELLDVRNRLAHNESFSYDDAERSLDSMRRLLEAIGAGVSASKISRMRESILRTKFSEQQRNQERKSGKKLDVQIESTTNLFSWRNVIEPHSDVASGNILQAEFAADLSKVHDGEAPEEYRSPVEFYARTYLTEGLSNLLLGAVRRLSGIGGDPVVELLTNFGGGKTHSMLALYHMAGQTNANDLPSLDQLLSRNRYSVPNNIHRAVLVGTARGPLDTKVVDGYEIKTTWGEMAWQLGGKDAYSIIADNDEKGIAPGSNVLCDLFRTYSPSLILIDEWVAYLRQIYNTVGLPAGSFDANLSFVQSLTEAVKASPKTLLVASLPASQIEVGGDGGQEALKRLKQTFSRVESSWRPASKEESYEIVRRRLFKEIEGHKYQHRDNTLKQFLKLYRENSIQFPKECNEAEYQRKLELSYPIHPELFDQLYSNWGSLEKFQRTRGVLRLMAQIIHELWIRNDPAALIMPGNVIINSSRVEPELLHYIDTNWQSIIDSDVDGIDSVPYKIDESVPNLARCSATRRIARTIFMATAPIGGNENIGLDDKKINLGVVLPGERLPVFGDALRRLSNQATFMHCDRGQYWYSTERNINKLAIERAESLDDSEISDSIEIALSNYFNRLPHRGSFENVHLLARGNIDIPDDSEGIKAVVLNDADAHNGKSDSLAISKAKTVLQMRSSSLRIFRNTLIFVAADEKQIDGLKESIRYSRAWNDIVREINNGHHDLRASAITLAKEKALEWNKTSISRLKNAWCYLLFPWQESAQSDIEWHFLRITVQDGVLTDASKKLMADEELLKDLGPARLNRDLEKYIWNENDHIHVKDLWNYTNQFIYLPRLQNREVLIRTIRGAISMLHAGPFAYAERYDSEAKRYHGLVNRGATSTPVVIDSESVIVRAEVARSCLDREIDGESKLPNQDLSDSIDGTTLGSDRPNDATSEETPTRLTGKISLSPDRSVRDMMQVVEGIIEQLTIVPKSSVSITLEVSAELPDGMDKNMQRTLNENARTLGFLTFDLS